ncbi:MAG: MFS transporter [Candidatus Thermoplasmatota archaeon]|nr:MFS transporter [Candidatus Thermoplasmatota archaeon]
MQRPPRLLWVISFHHACNDGTLMALVALIPLLVHVMGISYYEVGLLGFALLITVAVQYVVGRFADRVFSRYLLELGAGLMGLSFVLMLFVNEFLALFLAVAVMRVGASFYHPVGTSWITREYSGKYLETALGVQSSVGNFGVIIALGTSGFLGEAFGWRAPCALWAGLDFAAVLLGLFLIEDESIRTRSPGRGKTIRSERTMSKMLPLVVPIVAGGALYQITSYFGPVNLTSGGGWSAGTADLMFAMWIGVGTVTSYFFGRLSASYGKTHLLLAGYAVSALGVLVLAISTSWFVVGPALVIYGAVLFITYPALFAIVSDATDVEERGTAFGILFGFQLGGGAALVYASGIVADATGDPGYAFVIASALALASVVAIAYAGVRART